MIVAVRWYLRFGLSYRDVELHRLLPLLLQAYG
jgi:transposase-like protein